MTLPTKNVKSAAGSFGTVSKAVTPSDTTDLPSAPVRAVVCLTGGNISVVPANNAPSVPVAFVGVSAGFIPPFAVRRVMATGTNVTVMTVEG